MITIRPSRPEEIPQQKELWQKCFGDPMSYIDIFYQKFCTPDQVLVVDDSGEINSMAVMLETTLDLPGDGVIPVGYVYALATNPYMQGKGHARQLLKYADEYLQAKGMKAVTLVPASPSLHKFFDAIGMDEFFSTRKEEVLASAMTGNTRGGTLTPISPREYNEIREAQLKGTPHISYPDQLIHFQQIGSHLGYGDLYKLEIEGEVGCVAIEYVQKSRLLMKELLISTGKMDPAIELIAKEMPASRYHTRTPGSREGLPGSYLQPFGMIKWYDETLRAKWGNRQDAYLGLGFD